MKSKLINKTPLTFALVFQTGDEVTKLLKAFAQEQRLQGSYFSAIGAFSRITLGYFATEKREYEKIEINEQVEVLSLLGNIARSNGELKVHAHVVVGKRDGTAHGGHLIEARVRPTLEVVVEEAPAHLRRKFDPKSGLALIELDA